jgi:hypothetical protein
MNERENERVTRDSHAKDWTLINHSCDYSLITCIYCKATFVYIRVFRSKDEYDYDKKDTHFQQITCNYCPECGKKMER